MASASVLSVKRTGMSCLMAPCCSRAAKVSARAERSPTTMREGCRFVVQRLAFAQELGREEDVVSAVLLAHVAGVADRHRGFDDHHRVGVDGEYVFDDRFDAACVEEVGLGVVVGGRGDDDEVCVGVCVVLVERGAEVKRLVAQVALDFGIGDGRAAVVEHGHLLRDDVECHHLVVLGEEDGVGESDVAGLCDGDFHGWGLGLFVLISERGRVEISPLLGVTLHGSRLSWGRRETRSGRRV